MRREVLGIGRYPIKVSEVLIDICGHTASFTIGVSIGVSKVQDFRHFEHSLVSIGMYF